MRKVGIQTNFESPVSFLSVLKNGYRINTHVNDNICKIMKVDLHVHSLVSEVCNVGKKGAPLI